MASWLAVYGNKCVHKRVMGRLCRGSERYMRVSMMLVPSVRLLVLLRRLDLARTVNALNECVFKTNLLHSS